MADKLIANILGYKLTYDDRKRTYHAEIPSAVPGIPEDIYTESAIDAWMLYINALDTYAVDRIRRAERKKERPT